MYICISGGASMFKVSARLKLRQIKQCCFLGSVVLHTLTGEMASSATSSQSITGSVSQFREAYA
jgi:hypothetical protein